MGYALQSLRHRDFRLLWIGLAVSAVGTWMQIVAQSLLVLEITHGSALALGTVALAQASAFLTFAFLGGSWVDRLDKRRLLLFTQSACAGLALVLGILTRLGLVQFWMIVAIAFLNGTVLSFDHPARGVLLPALVPEEDMMNAIGLQSSIFNGAAAVGPAIAGVSVKSFGYAGNFFLNSASFMGVIIALLLMHPPDLPIYQRSIVRSISESLEAIAQDIVLPWVVVGYAALLFLGPSPALILPVFATHILHVGPERMGLLFSSVGVGSILGSLFASVTMKRKSSLYFFGLSAWVTAFCAFSVSHWFWISMAALVLLGAGQVLVAISAITLLQTRVPKQMRGRAMSLNTLLLLGLRPLGDFPAGALITLIGAPATTLLSAAIVGSYGALVSLTRPSIRTV